MKNVFVLPTDKPSRLSKDENDRIWLSINFEYGINDNNKQNIYITSDEEIKEGDWCLDIKRNIIFQSKRSEIGTSKKIPIIICTYEGCYIQKDCKKIILTTDQDLIKDGVQAIDDEFLEWFVKNPSCEEVDIMTDSYTMQQIYQLKLRPDIFKYKIIIPKEEQKQHLIEMMKADEELGLYEAAEYKSHHSEEDFIRGAKWQQERSYSEEEVLKLLVKMNEWPTTFNGEEEVEEWFEQIKKK